MSFEIRIRVPIRPQMEDFIDEYMELCDEREELNSNTSRRAGVHNQPWTGSNETTVGPSPLEGETFDQWRHRKYWSS